MVDPPGYFRFKKKELDTDKLRRLARGEPNTQDIEQFENPPPPIIEYHKRTDPGPNYWRAGVFDKTQDTVYSQ